MVMLVSEFKGEIDELLDNVEWVAELKRDGTRVQIRYTRNLLGTGLQIFNRKGELLSKEFPDVIKKQLLDSLNKDDYVTETILDGELTYTDKKGIDHRTQAQCKEAEPILWIWDILSLNEEDLKSRKWIERKTELRTVCDVYNWDYENDSCVRYLPHFLQHDGNINNKRGLLKIAEDNKMEGIVLKNSNALYEEGKSKNQFKVKFAQTDEFIVVGYTNATEFSTNTKGEQINNKRFPYFKALILTQYNKHGNLISKGQVGGGFKDDDLNIVTPMLNKDSTVIENSHNLIDKDYGVSKGKINWIRQKFWFIVEIKMHGLTEYKNPFQPRFVALRTDKKLEECIEK